MSLGRIGKYEKLDVLGHGSSGIVYLAWDTMLGKHVALKVINMQASEERRFLEEARVLDRLRHPNIVQVNNVDRIDGQLVIDMEYIKGTNLLQYLKQKNNLDVQEALYIAIQVCDALDYAHRSHTIHRDIKPANILINDKGDVKIVDFGLAEMLGSGSYAGGAGTYAYMAPEDFEEEEKSDHRSDIWAIGVTVYEMLTGVKPFQVQKAKDPFAWKRAIQEDEPAPVYEINPSIPREIQQVISRSLAKDKYKRYQTAGEMRDDLLKIMERIGGRKPSIAIEDATIPSRTADDLPTELLGKSYAGISTDADSLDFGSIRKKEPATRRITITVDGRGECSGRVVSNPDWISVSPRVFNKRRQTLLIKASADGISKPGIYNGNITIEADSKRISIPVTAQVLPERPRFYQIVWWYVPLLILCLLPPVLHHGGWLGGKPQVTLADITAMGLLSIMLYIIATFADLGVAERLIPALMGAVGLGVSIGAVWQEMMRGGILKPFDIVSTAMTGALLSFLIVLQLITASKWKAWGWILAIASVSASALLAGQ